MEPMNDGYILGMHWIWWLSWLAFMISFLILSYNANRKNNNTESPIDILRKRFAKGEITREEFEEKVEEMKHLN